MLRALVPPDHFDQCSRMRQAVVTEVQEVANMALWIQYKTKRQQIAERLSGSRDCPWASVVAPGVDVLRGYLPHAVLERCANEVLCIHGTTKESASHIANQGFDDRLGNRELYGRGIYCTTDACKAAVG